MAIGLRRDAAARFSFLLGVPAIGGPGYSSYQYCVDNISGGALAIGLVAAAVSGYASIAWLLRFLRAREHDPVRRLPHCAGRGAAGVARRRRLAPYLRLWRARH